MLWLLIGYMFLFIYRPFEVWPALGIFRIELIYMLLTGLVWAATPGKRWIANPLDKAFFAFAAPSEGDPRPQFPARAFFCPKLQRPERLRKTFSGS